MKCTVLVISIQLVLFSTRTFAQNNGIDGKETETISRRYKILESEVVDAGTGNEWYLNFPLLPIAVATSKTIPDGECKTQLQRYLRDLRNGTIWAMEMFDSSVKFPTGILEGQTTSFGNFDECYQLNVQLPSEENGRFTHIDGKYCLVDFQYEKQNYKPKFNEELSLRFDPRDSVWEAIVERGDFRRIKRYLLQMGLCVPAACSAEDVETSLKSTYSEFGLENNLNINVSVNPRNCQTRQDVPEFPTSSKIYCTLVAALIALVTIATIYDTNESTENRKNSHSAKMEALFCFSAKRNLRSIFEVKYNHPSLDCIHFIRFAYIFVVLSGHRISHFLTLPTINARTMPEASLEHPFYLFLHGGTIIIDVFVAMSGLLTCYGLLDTLDKTKRFAFVKFLLIRLLRFIPSYAFVIFAYVTILPYIGSGPLWQAKVSLESERCTNHWWKNLLFINNFVDTNDKCMFQSWYMSSDIQLYILGIILIYVFWKLPRKIGYGFLGLLLFISTVITFLITYINQTQAIYIQYPYLNDILDDHYLTTYYMKPYMHISAYLLGAITGAIIYDTNFVTWRIPSILSNILMPTCTVICILSMVPGHKYYNPNTVASQFEKSFYSSIHRVTYAGAVCLSLVLANVGSGIEIYHRIVKPGWVQPFGRLSFGMYLVHGFFQVYSMGVMRAPKAASFFDWLVESMSDYVLSYALALILSICIEGPFRRIETIFLRSSKNKPLNDTSRQENVVKKSS